MIKFDFDFLDSYPKPKDLDDLSSVFSFLFVRHPFERFVSSYEFLNLGKVIKKGAHKFNIIVSSPIKTRC